MVTSVVATGNGITAGAGDLYAGEVVTLTVNLSQAVSVAGGTPTLTLNDGGTATYTGGSGTNALNFSYTVAAGQTTPALAVTAVNLNGATVTNSIPTTVTASTVTAGSGGSLTDANGHVWSFGATQGRWRLCHFARWGSICRRFGETLTLVNGVIWTENSRNKWYEATATGWIAGIEWARNDIVDRCAGQAANLAGAVTTLSGPLQVDIATTTGPVVTSVVATGNGITAGVGDVYAGEVVTLTVNLSQAVSVAGGTPTLTLNDGGTATYTGGSGTNALNFSYTVAAGQTTPALAVTAVNLNGATVTNSIPTTVTASSPSGGSLTDANGHVWSFSATQAGGGYVILRDGVQFAGGSGETLTLVNGVIWTENSGNKWYEATGTGWIAGIEWACNDIVDGCAGQAANLGGAVTTLSGPLQVDIATTTGPVVTSVVATGNGITAGVGDLYAGAVVTLTVNLSQAVAVAGGTPTLTLNDGGTATYTGGSGTNALNFSYTVAAGQTTPALAVTAVNLNGATVTNSIPTTVTASMRRQRRLADRCQWSRLVFWCHSRPVAAMSFCATVFNLPAVRAKHSPW